MPRWCCQGWLAEQLLREGRSRDSGISVLGSLETQKVSLLEKDLVRIQLDQSQNLLSQLGPKMVLGRWYWLGVVKFSIRTKLSNWSIGEHIFRVWVM